MSIGLRLDLRQTQQLVMTPQLQQAIKLLQMSNIELAEFVEGEIEKNPLLVKETTDASGTEEPAPAVAVDDGPSATDQRQDDHSLTSETFDTGAENLHDSSPSDGPNPLGETRAPSGASSGAARDGLPGFEESLAEPISLRDHLRAQIGQTRCDADIAQIARFLIEELDEHGYLRADLNEIAERLDVAPPRVRTALRLLQGCEPTGVAARDVGECLALQLAERNLLDPKMAGLIDNLGLIAKGDLKRLRNAIRASEADLARMIRVLRGLDPRPCARFDTTEPETLIPDVLLRRTEWGTWQVELNADTLPRVLIDRKYAAEIARKDCPATGQFLMDCQSSANWLIKSLDQRARTIVNVASEIVRRQQAFFAYGISGLKPMTLREVADAVGVHESTASRVTSNKYIATERGIFELRFFFTNAIGTGPNGMAAESVRHRIKVMVEAEKPDNVLSDDTIVERLGAEGIEIARRTVAKYRKSLGIPSSVDRRRLKSLA